MGRGAAWVGRIIVVIALVVAAPLAIHAGITGASWPLLTPVVLAVQLIVVGAALAIQRPARIKWLVLAAVALVASLLWARDAGLSLSAMPGLPHALAYSALLIGFGMSLMPGHTAILTRMATSLRGALPRDLLIYTRRVTAVWCGFFAGQLLLSLCLYAWAPLTVWSFFINVLNLPLVLLLFAAEYGYRVIRFRAYQHDSLSETIHVLAKSSWGGSR
jgi:uncharacterized membrane protein